MVHTIQMLNNNLYSPHEVVLKLKHRCVLYVYYLYKLYPDV